MLLYLLITLAGLLIFGLMSFGALQYALLQGKKTHLQGREDRLISLLNENRAKGGSVPLSEQPNNYALVTHEGNLFHIHNLDGSLFFPSEGIGRDWALPVEDGCTQPVFSSVVLDKQYCACHVSHDPSRWPHGPAPHRGLVGGGGLRSANVSQRSFSSSAMPIDSLFPQRIFS